LMLVTWPQRREMIQQAIVSFVNQDYVHATLTIVNDGSPCQLSKAFWATHRQGVVVRVPPGTSIGEKRNAGAHATDADFIASFDDDDFCLPSRLTSQLARIGANVWLSASRKFISLQSLENIVGFEYGRCYGAGMISAHCDSFPRLTAGPSPQCSVCSCVYRQACFRRAAMA